MSDLLRVESLLSQAADRLRRGDRVSARRLFGDAAAVAAETRNADALARAALGFADVPWPTLSVGDAESVALLEESLGRLDDSDPLSAVVLARLARDHQAHDLRRREELSLEAVTRARKLRDSSALASALVDRVWSAWSPDHLDDRIAYSFEALEAADEAGDVRLRIQARMSLMIALVEAGNVQGADAEADPYEEDATRLGEPVFRAWLYAFRAMRALMSGRFAAAEASAAAVLEFAKSYGDPHAPVWFVTAVLGVHIERGTVETVLESAESLFDQYAWMGAVGAALSYAYSAAGRPAAARREFDRLAANDFSSMSRDLAYVLGLTFLADTCRLLDDERSAPVLYKLLLPFAGRNAVGPGAAISNGAVSRSLGVLATMMSRFDAAEQHFAAAESLNASMGALPSQARTHVAHARMLQARGDGPAATALLDEALTTASELGMAGLLQEIEDARRHRLAVATPLRAPSGPAAELRLEGEYWTVGYEGTTFRLKDSKGLRYLAMLIGAPHREIHALELVAAAEGHVGVDRPVELQPGWRDAGPALDAEAKAAYRSRLADVEAELEEAREWSDPARVEALESERSALISELAAAVGLGGRDRRMGSDEERARVAVTKAIRSAVDRIARECGPLGEVLRQSLRTGTYCRYAPELDLAPLWQL